MRASSSGFCVSFVCAVSHLTDGAGRRTVEIIYLRAGQKPRDHVPWLIIVKTHSLDFELIATVSRYFPPFTIGTDAMFEAALDRAMHSADKYFVDAIYVTGFAEE